MKKLLATLLVIGVLFGVTASGEEVSIDLTAMSTDELIALRSEITAEIEKRTRTTSTNAVEICSGTYVIGVDIPAGTYLFTYPGYRNLGMSSEDFEYVSPYLHVRSGTELLEVYEFMTAGETIRVTLPDGAELELECFTGTIEPASALFN